MNEEENLKNCPECGEDMRAYDDLCRRCQGQKDDDECDGYHSAY
mgnify:CR=1 FL=1